MVRSMEVDDDIEVTVQALTDAEILEEIQGDAVVVEEDDEEESSAEDEVPVKSSNEQVRQAIETLLTYSIFTENFKKMKVIREAMQNNGDKYNSGERIKKFLKNPSQECGTLFPILHQIKNAT